MLRNIKTIKNLLTLRINRFHSSHTAKIFYDNDADLSLLKNKTISILGYGSQGHAQAQNLRDSGCNVVIGQRSGSLNYDLAVSHGFKPLSIVEATDKGDIINILLPDEVQSDIYNKYIQEFLKEGDILMCSHGFNFHYGQIETPKYIDKLLIAPKGPGHLVRSEFEKGGGVPSLIAVNDGASKETFDFGLAYAKGIGGTRAGVILTTIAEETETDLFGEQVVLCGGVSELVRSSFDILVEAGYQPEMAYFECLHELKLIVDLFYQGGLNYMRYSISNTAEFGDYTRGKRIITDETRQEMKRILQEIQNGEFAKEWILENKAGAPTFKSMRRKAKETELEKVGLKLRRLMSWIDSK